MCIKYFLVSCIICIIYTKDVESSEKLLTSMDHLYHDLVSGHWRAKNVEMDRKAPSEPISCDANSKYRTFDGSCNHLDNPTLGMAKTPYLRLLPSNYQDGNYTLPLATDGTPKPLARRLSTELFPEKNNPDKVNLMAMQWGQIVAHDIILTPPNGADDECCSSNPVEQPLCVDLEIPSDDYFYSQFEVTCIGVRRNSIEVIDGSVEQINHVTHFIDGSLIYGSDEETAHSLRTFRNGKLRADVLRNGKEFLPKVATVRSMLAPPFCVPSDTNECYEAGDVRVNQNPQLTALQLVLMREHNRIAGELQMLNANWNDEKVFQEARAIVIATIQHISYNEWLGVYVGSFFMRFYQLLPKSSGYIEFQPDLQPVIINSFASSVFRLIHSAIQTNLSFIDYNGEEMGQVPFSDVLNLPSSLKQCNGYDQYLLGLVHQPMQQMDTYFTEQITNKLFSRPLPYGRDLIGIDILRGRDNGLPGYTKYLETCADTEIKEFDDLLEYIPREVSGLHDTQSPHVTKLQEVYKSVDDIDLYVGAALEKVPEGTRFGTTSLCILAAQFNYLRWSDRFWYEMGDQPNSLKEDQLQEIRKVSASRLLCDNGDKIEKVPKSSFKFVSESNPIVDCEELPKIDLSKWKEN